MRCYTLRDDIAIKECKGYIAIVGLSGPFFSSWNPRKRVGIWIRKAPGKANNVSRNKGARKVKLRFAIIPGWLTDIGVILLKAFANTFINVSW